MPHEFILGEIYLPPLLVVCGLAYLLMMGAMYIVTRLGWLQYFAFPALLEVSLVVIFIWIFNHFIAI